MQAASRSIALEISATLMRLTFYVFSLVVFAGGATRLYQVTARLGSEVEPPATWINVERPHPAFQLVMPELAGSASNYTIARRPADGARRDRLTYGNVAEPGPYMLVEIYRPGPRGEHFLDAPSEVAARIIDFTVTDDVKPAGRIASKFGPVPLVDFAIADEGVTRRCLGFARPSDAPAMEIAGWYCSAGEEVVDRTTLGCALDRLTILTAGGDRKLDQLFARAELNRTFCGRRSPILAATPEREDPIIKGQRPKLRGRLSAR